MNDPAFAVPESLVEATAAEAPVSSQLVLTEAELAPLVAEAWSRWIEDAEPSANALSCTIHDA